MHKPVCLSNKCAISFLSCPLHPVLQLQCASLTAHKCSSRRAQDPEEMKASEMRVGCMEGRGLGLPNVTAYNNNGEPSAWLVQESQTGSQVPHHCSRSPSFLTHVALLCLVWATLFLVSLRCSSCHTCHSWLSTAGKAGSHNCSRSAQPLPSRRMAAGSTQ